MITAATAHTESATPKSARAGVAASRPSAVFLTSSSIRSVMLSAYP